MLPKLAYCLAVKEAAVQFSHILTGEGDGLETLRTIQQAPAGNGLG